MPFPSAFGAYLGVILQGQMNSAPIIGIHLTHRDWFSDSL
jgi:hypothetical protein